ncbi:MAG: YHS domain-containing protein [Candidatus Loosdrechtia sp.]|uniref:YHS domain-containing protein n=1 Tax=Candidatus Loosdrechtia sp. TaxID=3101272 RepID=UPI003A6E00DD|nr:MAG: YHS domain-containing protein [Candidatus Jettenia sp. AMX2]
MSTILRIIFVCIFIVSLGAAYSGKSLWASSCCGSNKADKQATQTKTKVTNENHDTIKDPVCGMKIDAIKKAPSKKYKGNVYYFCSKGCKKTFVKDPASYTLTENSQHEEE